MRKFIALTLLAVAGAAAAQSPAPSQSPPPPQQPPAASPERKATSGQSGLNLKLDNAARFSETTGGAADALPSLGGDARPLERRAPASTRTTPFPTSSEQVHQ